MKQDGREPCRNPRPSIGGLGVGNARSPQPVLAKLTTRARSPVAPRLAFFLFPPLNSPVAKRVL